MTVVHTHNCPLHCNVSHGLWNSEGFSTWETTTFQLRVSGFILGVSGFIRRVSESSPALHAHCQFHRSTHTSPAAGLLPEPSSTFSILVLLSPSPQNNQSDPAQV